MNGIYEPKGKAREYSELACNLFTGCIHGCRYCYAPAIMHTTRNRWTEQSRPRKGILEQIEKDAKRLAGDARPVLFCFTSDPCQTADAIDLTMAALSILRQNDIPAMVLTKAGLKAVPLLDTLATMKPLSSLGCSISFWDPYDNELRPEWEPGAASIGDRVRLLATAKACHIPTWVSVEPVLDPAGALEMLDEILPLDIVDHWKIGKLNHDAELEASIDWNAFLTAVMDRMIETKVSYYIKRDLALAGGMTPMPLPTVQQFPKEVTK